MPIGRGSKSPQTWKPSELPIHPDDSEYQYFDFGPTPDNALINSAIASEEDLWKTFDPAPFPGHRWLPLTQNTTSLLSTPMSRITPDPWGVGVHHWAVAAQQHMSLFQNIENNTLHKYWMTAVPPLGDGLWNMQYTRYNLNFIAVWGRDVRAGAGIYKDPKTGLMTSTLFDDEKNITADMPRALGREMMIDTQALVAHMHFHDQEVGIQMTDMLDRYRAFVNDRVCAPARQKSPPGMVGGLGWTEKNGGEGWWRCPWVAAAAPP